MKKLFFFIPPILLIIAAVILVITRQGILTSSTSNLKIVAGENFWGDIASQIAGKNVDVISIISDPNQDPHAYESTTTDALNVSSASIVIENGVGYDTFIDKILSTTYGKDIINVGKLAHLTDGDNPHMWYNLNYVRAMAAALKDDLEKQDPQDTSVYEANYNTFISSLAPIETLCRSIQTNYSGTQVIPTERVFNYMLANCGLTVIHNDFQKAIEEGNDPSVQSINAFTNTLNTHQVKALVYNQQTISQVTQQMQDLAKKNNIPIVGVTETMPLHTTYQQWVLNELTNLHNALIAG